MFTKDDLFTLLLIMPGALLLSVLTELSWWQHVAVTMALFVGGVIEGRRPHG